jgi:gamma-glutamyltranspeptidase/glutathione hydrolase
LSPDVLRRLGMAAMPSTAVHSVTVPGAVAGWAALLDRFGRLGLADVLAPARYYADRGFPVGPTVAEGWAALKDALSDPGATAATYLPDGRAPKAGAIFRNPDLAESLRLVAEQGPDAFYRGAIAEAVVRLSRTYGGTMTAQDLASFEPEWVTRSPRSTAAGPSSSCPQTPRHRGADDAGPHGADAARRFGFHSVDALHVMIEAKKLAYADMLRWVGDPHFGSAPTAALLDKRRSARARGVHRHGPGGGTGAADRVEGLTTTRAATRSTWRRSIATATSCR